MKRFSADRPDAGRVTVDLTDTPGSRAASDSSARTYGSRSVMSTMSRPWFAA